MWLSLRSGCRTIDYPSIVDTCDYTVIRILLADDYPIFRDGLRRLLESEPGFEGIGEASDGDEAVTMARSLII
jgi:hypothetical protein